MCRAILKYLKQILIIEIILIVIIFCYLAGLEVIKAFGPVIASGFLGWVAYNQFKLALSQSDISKEQLALAKQQADIAKKKVELDIRDKKYEVFRRWNKAYYQILDQAYSEDIKDYKSSLEIFAAVSDEILFTFNNDKGIHEKRGCIINGFRGILLIKKDFFELHFRRKQDEDEVEYEEYKDHYIEIAKKMEQVIRDRNAFLQTVFHELIIM